MSNRDSLSQTRACAAFRIGSAAALLMMAALFLGPATPIASAAEKMVKSGTIKIEQVQIAFIGSGNLGGGTLYYEGRSYPFTVGGLGIGGFGASSIRAEGDVYNLTNLAFFPGAYAQLRYGAVLGDVGTGGELMLQNPNGVVLRLRAEQTGLAVSLGGDAMYIKLD